MRTIGSEALAAKVAEHGAMSELAIRLNVLPNMVSRWASGQRVPRLSMLLRLENELGIPVRSWGEELPDAGSTEGAA